MFIRNILYTTCGVLSTPLNSEFKGKKKYTVPTCVLFGALSFGTIPLTALLAKSVMNWTGMSPEKGNTARKANKLSHEILLNKLQKGYPQIHAQGIQHYQAKQELNVLVDTIENSKLLLEEYKSNYEKANKKTKSSVDSKIQNFDLENSQQQVVMNIHLLNQRLENLDTDSVEYHNIRLNILTELNYQYMCISHLANEFDHFTFPDNKPHGTRLAEVITSIQTVKNSFDYPENPFSDEFKTVFKNMDSLIVELQKIQDLLGSSPEMEKTVGDLKLFPFYLNLFARASELYNNLEFNHLPKEEAKNRIDMSNFNCVIVELLSNATKVTNKYN